MKKLALPLLIFCIIFLGCGKSDSPAPEIAQEQEPDPIDTPEIKDPDDVDYWNDAELVWSDEFDGTSVSSDNWIFEDRASGWVNNELQNYQPQGNTEVSDGTLKITAKKNSDNSIEGAFTSARMNSKQSFKYGRMEIRAKMPEHKGNGLWPALWMLGSNIETVGWPACGEIDIMEYVSFKPNKTHFSIHSTANNHTNNTEITSGAVDLETIEEEFHTFGLLWSAKYLKFYLDDIDNVQFVFRRPITFTTDSWPFQNNFYFIMNVAVGGDWGGLEGVDTSIFPATMEVDYVRVYQVK
ncbi:glycoside hydrolase family 16 protein [Maribacter algarum]|uniref:Glycoside hydrolase family 16 protein n=1 Tax=Maribacter algarum (ex Zhang et al. 2020) TaxID=2578118 RepID=A0A5S3PTF2_9FLAO|nr:glycoside hydrolase family 16 protein [Maribacter algarum]TMM57193.1 glycoside hydrolase family 16 protein [Maribacter algarum]